MRCTPGESNQKTRTPELDNLLFATVRRGGYLYIVSKMAMWCAGVVCQFGSKMLTTVKMLVRFTMDFNLSCCSNLAQTLALSPATLLCLPSLSITLQRWQPLLQLSSLQLYLAWLLQLKFKKFPTIWDKNLKKISQHFDDIKCMVHNLVKFDFTFGLIKNVVHLAVFTVGLGRHIHIISYGNT